MTRPWERAAARAGGPDVARALAAMPASELCALLLEVYARRAAATGPADVRRRFAADAFVRPSPVDQRAMTRLDEHLLARVPAAFEAVELSPLAPYGACTAVAPVHPNNVLASARGHEVVADCTNVMALLSAERRAAAPVVRLVTSHRLVRGQRFDKPGFTQHFRLLALTTAGRDPGGRRFEADAIGEQLEVLLDLLASLPDGYQTRDLGVTLSWDRDHEDAAARVRARLADARPGLFFREEPDRLRESRYYRGLAFRVHATSPRGDAFPIGDGGLVDWLAKLRSDKKERFAIAALGTELLVKAFREEA